MSIGFWCCARSVSPSPRGWSTAWSCYLLRCLRLSNPRNLWFEVQIEPFPYPFRVVGCGKICSIYGCWCHPKLGPLTSSCNRAFRNQVITTIFKTAITNAQQLTLSRNCRHHGVFGRTRRPFRGLSGTQTSTPDKDRPLYQGGKVRLSGFHVRVIGAFPAFS